MQAKNRRVASCTSLAMILVLAAIANAAIQFDQSVTGGVIFGSGNFNGGFTVDRDSIPGLELGLRTHTRFPSSDGTAAGIMSQGDGIYGNFAALGFFTDGSLGGPRASWNFDFSINSNYDGTGGNLSGLTFLLNIDYDPSAGTSFLAINPLTAISDNAYGTNSGLVAVGTSGSSAGLVATTNLAQNSEQLNFFAGAPPFNPNVSGVYDISLQAFQNGELVGQTQIQVDVGSVPEPTSLTMWGLCTLGCAIGVFRRRKSV
jgi:hypothetical protein